MHDGATCPHCGFNTAPSFKSCPACKRPMVLPPVAPPPPATPPQGPPLHELARARQPAPVLADPKYMLDTGFGAGCPTCGSTSLKLVPKPGLGIGFIGSLGHVITASLIASRVEEELQKRIRQPVECNYCGAKFELDRT